jgi:hypothetical protein
LSHYEIQSFTPLQHPSTLLTPILTDEREDVLGHPLVPVVVWSELELDQVNLPQEDVDHSQFFGLILAILKGLLRYVIVALKCSDNVFGLILFVIIG